VDSIVQEPEAGSLAWAAFSVLAASLTFSTRWIREHAASSSLKRERKISTEVVLRYALRVPSATILCDRFQLAKRKTRRAESSSGGGTIARHSCRRNAREEHPSSGHVKARARATSARFPPPARNANAIAIL
jgi:hypothetical protein